SHFINAKTAAVNIIIPEILLTLLSRIMCSVFSHQSKNPAEMKKNNAEVIHLATGLIVGYPPCPRITQFRDFIQEKYNMKVVIGTHPIPQKYYITHTALHTWESPIWKELIEPTLAGRNRRFLSVRFIFSFTILCILLRMCGSDYR
ncbi:unnamed protein product, partial [marine sediment metagenome]